MKILALVGLVLAGVNDDGSPCYIGNCWNNNTELVNWTASNSTGAPVWADDGSVGITFELFYERKLELPPLDGYWAKRHFNYRLVTQKIGESKQYLTGIQKGRPLQDYLFFIKSAGYALVKIYDDIKMQITDYKVGVDGSFTVLPASYYIPSPDGKLLSSLSCNQSSCSLAFLDSQSLNAVGNSFSLNLSGTQSTRWTSRNQFIVSDASNHSYSIDPFGNAVDIPLSVCFGAQTTSSKINTNGDIIGITRDWFFNERMSVIGKASVSEKFDCK
ncbi:hypothetical protein HDV04_001602 [Boothiomyces sp. JEL0838]|nr:hypothetical protein HDV04_001602 [Boothiomyces sp. JEL0838]